MKKSIALFLLMSFLSGCFGTTLLKAPCNSTGSNCGERIKINQWADNN